MALADAILAGEVVSADQREQELIDEVASEPAALSSQPDPYGIKDAIADETAERGGVERVRRVTAVDIAAKLRDKLYAKLDSLDGKELAMLYLQELKTEEARLRVTARGKPTNEAKALRQKARDAILGAGGTITDDDGDD